MNRDDLKIGEETPEYPGLEVLEILEYWTEEPMKPINVFQKELNRRRHNWIIRTVVGHRLVSRYDNTIL